MRIYPIALCLGLGITTGAAPAAHAKYDVTVLQDAGGTGASQPIGINASGWTVGDSFNSSGGDDAVLWSPSGKATVLQDVGGLGTSYASAINAAGQIAGSSESTADGGSEAVLWSPVGKGDGAAGRGRPGRQLRRTHQLCRAERRTFLHPGQRRGGAMVAIGEGDGSSGRGRGNSYFVSDMNEFRANRWIYLWAWRRCRCPYQGGAVVAIGEGDGASGRRRPGRQRALCHQRFGVERRIFRYRGRLRIEPGRGSVVPVGEGDGASGRRRPGYQSALCHQRRRAERRVFRPA